jgi:plastocyanin
MDLAYNPICHNEYKMKILSKLLVVLTMVSLFASSALAATGFSDVPVTHVNYKAIMALKEDGIIGGYPDGSFRPDQVVNRVEALKIILGAAKIVVSNESGLGLGGLTDVDSTQWYANYLKKALALKIVQGYPDGTFKPTQTVNLVENLKILTLATKADLSKIVVNENPFADASKDQWYAKYLQYAKLSRLVDADEFGKIYPAQGMTRAKLAEVAYRQLYLQENQIDIYPPQQEITPDDAGNDPNEVILQVNMKNMAFMPAAMTIGLGSKVRFTNADNVNHSVISDSGNELSSPILENGDSYDHVFDKLGTFDYHCGLHPSMKAKIIVKPAIEVPTI